MTPEISKNTENFNNSIPDSIASRNAHDKLLSQKKHNELYMRADFDSKINVIDSIVSDYSTRNYHHELAEKYAGGVISYEKLKELWGSETPLTISDDRKLKYPKNTSPEMIVEDFMHGKITSYKKYNKLFNKFLYGKSPLEKLVDSVRDKKNQVVGKVVDFVKRIGIFEK